MRNLWASDHGRLNRAAQERQLIAIGYCLGHPWRRLALFRFEANPAGKAYQRQVAENHVTILTNSHDPKFTGFIFPRRTSTMA